MQFTIWLSSPAEIGREVSLSPLNLRRSNFTPSSDKSPHHLANVSNKTHFSADNFRFLFRQTRKNCSSTSKIVFASLASIKKSSNLRLDWHEWLQSKAPL